MMQIIDALKGLFASAVKSGGDASKTAGFVLENVDWNGKLNVLETAGHPIVEKHLEETCAKSGKSGSSTHRLADSLLSEKDHLKWRTRAFKPEDGPEIKAFASNYSATTVIGNGGLLPSDKVSAGFSLQGCNAFYPPHAHVAEESYWTIGGEGEWKVDDDPWFAVESGSSIYHKSGALHAMRTGDKPMLSVWLWTSHLDSEVVIIKGQNNNE